MEERRDRLIARLEQRNEERKGNFNSSDETKNEADKIEELMREIQIDLDGKKVDAGKIDRLQELQTFIVNNRQTKAIQNLLEDVRKFKMTVNNGPKFTGFSFKKTAPPTAKTTTVETEKPKLPSSISAPPISENIVENLKNEKKTISGKNGEDLSLKNVEDCRLQFDFEPSVVHIRNLKNSTLIFSRCDRSLLINDCENVHIYVAAQQVRVHTSENLHLHVATRGAVILEDSTGIVMYPYRVKTSTDEYISAEDNGEWRAPRDFNWLAASPSPNWRIADEHEVSEERLLPTA